MQVVKSYRAYYDEGIFIPYEPVTVPKGSQAVITILDFAFDAARDTAGTTNEASRRQIEAMRRFREEIRSNDEPVPEFERVTLREVEV
ncbi:MAG: DUF104 domain-containing protein [Defluviitaleaceae bacterium]|nr:DUF104 domain-containing protein [Defluviitaleaceae bacterium]MCL2240755.1 DUF104 domain-containing protein [Defluviitaleaceae bacterium]